MFIYNHSDEGYHAQLKAGCLDESILTVQYVESEDEHTRDTSRDGQARHRHGDVGVPGKVG